MTHPSPPANTESDGATEANPAALKARYRWTILVLSLVALSASAFLAWSTIKVGSVVGCGNDGVFDCSHVLQSRWSKVLGIPVSLPAAALHITLILLLIVSALRVPAWLRRRAETGVLLAAFCAAAAAFWFVGLQVFAIGKLCQYCLVAHSAGLLAGIVALIGFGFRFDRIAKPAGLAMAMTAVLVGIQVLGPVPETALIESYDVADTSTEDFEALEMNFDDFESLDAPTELAIDEGIDGGRLPRPSGLVATSYEMQATQAGGGDATPTPTPTPAAGTTAETSGTPSEELQVEPASVEGELQPDPADSDEIEIDALEFSELEGELESDPVATPTPVPQSADENTERAVNNAPREIAYPGAKTKLKVQQWPLIGSASAPVVVVELFDYTCPHCREMNRQIEVARQRFGDQVAFVVLPVPLNSNCNQTVKQDNPKHVDSCEIANIAMSVWRIDKSVFPRFHHWLCEPEEGRTAAEARLQANSLVDPEALRRELSGSVIGKFLAQHVMIYKKAGEGILPKIFSEKITVSGKMSSADALCDALRNSHGISPR